MSLRPRSYFSQLKEKKVAREGRPCVNNNSTYVLFTVDKEVDSSKDVLDDLENIDDDLDKLGIPFVKIDDDSIAKDFGILDELPALVYFEDEIPSVYEGDLHNEEKALKWIIKQAQEDTIEEVTEEMLNFLVKDKEYVLVFYGKLRALTYLWCS